MTRRATLATIAIYEIGLCLIGAWSLLQRASELAEVRKGTWFEAVPIPAWWWALVIIPPLLLILVRTFRGR